MTYNLFSVLTICNNYINKVRTSNGELAAEILPQRWNVNWTESVEDLKVK